MEDIRIVKQKDRIYVIGGSLRVVSKKNEAIKSAKKYKKVKSFERQEENEMRIYSDVVLKNSTKKRLNKLLDSVKTSNDLTDEEKLENIKKIEFYLNGASIEKSIVAEMEAGAADISDIGGMN